jgi:hypothetical protein
VILVLEAVSLGLEALQQMLFLGDGLKQLSVVFFSVEEATDELLGVTHVSIASDFVIGGLNDLIL